jgi:putative nucleotidyltransferase with HDIG domain
MSSTEVLEQIEAMGELPVLPQTLLQIQSVATDDRSSAEDLAAVILRDEALTMKVLKVVNSSFYASRRRKDEVRTVSKAVVAMGFEQVRRIALGLSMFDMMSKLSRSPHLAEIARHSIVVAAFAQRLAEACRRALPEEAFVAGLIHDIGKVVLIECSPQRYEQVLLDIAAGAQAEDAERAQFGITHQRAGRKLAARWGLPHDLQSLIGDHHDIDPLRPPRALDPMQGILVYADAIAHFRCDVAHRDREREILRAAARALGIGTSAMEDIYAEAVAGLADLAGRLNVGGGDLPDFLVLLKEGGTAPKPVAPDPQEAVRRTAALLALHRDINKRMSAGEDSERLLARVVEAAHRIVGFERVLLLKVEVRTHGLQTWLWAGPGAAELAPAFTLPSPEGLGAVAETVTQGRGFHVPFARSEAYGSHAGPLLLEITRTRSYATAALQVGGRVAGVLWADLGADGDEVQADRAQDLQELAVQAGLLLERPVLARRQ